MNIDFGAQMLVELSEKKLINAPRNIQLGRSFNEIDFDRLIRAGGNGVSVYIGVPVGFSNLSLYKYKNEVLSHDSRAVFFKKHGLQDINEILALVV